MLLYIKTQKTPLEKLLWLICTFSKVTVYKIHRKKSIISYVQRADIFTKKSRKQYTLQYPQKQKA